MSFVELNDFGMIQIENSNPIYVPIHSHHPHGKSLIIIIVFFDIKVQGVIKFGKNTTEHYGGGRGGSNENQSTT